MIAVSVNHTLSGKIYNKSVQAVKLIYEETFKSFNKNYIDFVDNIKDSGGDFTAYWLVY